MSAAVASVAWSAEDSASPCTVSKPAGFASGDILVAVFIQHNNPSAQSDLTTPTGWTFQGAFDGVLADGKVFSHVFNSGDPSTWDFPYKSTADVCMGLFRITGADTTPTIVVSTTPTASVTNPMDSPSVTPSASDDLLLCCISDICNGTQLTVTVPSGMTSQGLGEVTGHFMSTYGASQQLASASATGVKTWTTVAPTGITGGTWTIAIKSASTGTTNGAASPAGAGAVTATATTGSTASPTGAGAVTAGAVTIATCSIVGAGGLTAKATLGASSAPAGAGTLTAAGSSSGAANAAPAGAGALAATARILSSAAPAGAGVLTASPTLQAACAPAGAGALAATGTVIIQGAATIVGAGAVATSVRTIAGAALAGVGGVTEVYSQTLIGFSAPAGAGALSAVGAEVVVSPQPYLTDSDGGTRSSVDGGPATYGSIE